MTTRPVSAQTLGRLPIYVSFLRSLGNTAPDYISATSIAEALRLNDVQVRKDLASVSDSGRPKIGYNTRDLIVEIEDYLGINDHHSAVITGVGNMGRALMSYAGFTAYGLRIVAGFDDRSEIVGTEIEGKPVFRPDRMRELCERLHVRIGIITVPAESAQEVCDAYVRCGIRAIWNFSPTRLVAPPEVLIRSENMAYSLAVLSRHLSDRDQSKDLPTL